MISFVGIVLRFHRVIIIVGYNVLRSCCVFSGSPSFSYDVECVLYYVNLCYYKIIIVFVWCFRQIGRIS